MGTSQPGKSACALSMQTRCTENTRTLAFPSPLFAQRQQGVVGVDVWVPCLAKRLPSIGPRRPCVIRLRLDADRTNSGRPCTCTASRSVLICFIFFSKILIHEMGSGDELL